MVALGKNNWLAAVLGIILTGVPMLWFTQWLRKQGDAEALIMASRAIGTAEYRIDQAVAVLDNLATQGVDSCKPSHLEMLRQTVFVSGPIKELALVGSTGQTLCTETGVQAGNRDVLASAATSSSYIMLDVIRLGDWHERMLRVRRLSSAGMPNLAALIPASLLLPQIATSGSSDGNSVRITLADGTLIGTAGVEPVAVGAGEDHIVGRQRSERYGPVVSVAMTREGVIATYDDLRRISMVVAGGFSCIILIMALVIPWRQRHDPISEIERAMVAGEFVPFFQPIVDIKSGRLLGAEVLVRWRKSDGTLVSPGAFIPLVESSGLILDMTRSLMRQVCIEVGAVLARRPHMYVAFNIVPEHFTDALVLNDVGSIFDGSPIRLSQVVLEMTERNEIEDLTACRRVIAALQGLGVRIAIDDVGTGHSGLSYILKLGVDIIKIDKMFVDAIGAERHSQAIVGTLVDLANNLRMQIVAEGVENFEQVTYLRGHGISAVQGFVFAPPLPGKAFIQLVEKIDPLEAPVAAADKEHSPPVGSAADRLAAA